MSHYSYETIESSEVRQKVLFSSLDIDVLLFVCFVFFMKIK